MILPFAIVTIFNWIMFVLIMVSIYRHTQGPVTDKNKGSSKLKALQTKFKIAVTLAVVFGLGWALGLAATSLPVKELTLTFQILFSVFVGAQGMLLFLLHGMRNQDIRTVWIQCFAAIGRKSHLANMMSSTKTSSVHHGSESLQATGSASGHGILTTSEKKRSAMDSTYSKEPYQSSVRGSEAIEMFPASQGDWGQSEGGLEQASFADGEKEHVNDNSC